MLGPQRIFDELMDENPDASIFDNMNEALVGYGRIGHNDPVAVYSKKKMFAKLHADGFSAEDAEEYFGKFVNLWAAENTPVILEDVSEE